MSEHEFLETTRALATVAKLRLSEERLGEVAPRLAQMRAFIESSYGVPLEDLEPAHVLPMPEWDDE